MRCRASNSPLVSKPGEETPEDYLGEAHASLGQYAQAAEAYRQAMQRSHNSEESLEAWAGFALERFRQIGESLRACEAGVATVRRLQEAATKPSTMMKCPEPIPALELKLAARPAPADAHMQTAYKLSICYAVEAGNAAQLLQANNKDDATLHRLRGDVLLRLKQDPASAQEEYRKAIALRPGDPALLARLGEAQLATGDTEAATQSAQAALAIDPHRREALRTLAFLAMSNREYDQALPWLRQLAAESPDDRKVQVELGRALAQTGESAEALRYLAPALDAGYPDEKGALHALEARVLRDLGREEEAAKASAEARRLSDAFQARSKVTRERKCRRVGATCCVTLALAGGAFWAHGCDASLAQAANLQAGQIAPIRMFNGASAAGLNFVLRNSAAGRKYQVETLPGGLGVIDFDNDGWPDLFCTNGASLPSLIKTGSDYWNRLYRNNRDGTFSDVTEKAGLQGQGYSMGVAVGDFDNDGHEDLFVVGVHGNHLYRNNGDGSFTDVTRAAGLAGPGSLGKPAWSVGACWIDYDNDGRLDLFISNYCDWEPGTDPICGGVQAKSRAYCHPDRYRAESMQLYHNNGDGTFTEVTHKQGLPDVLGKGMGLAIADFAG